ncbi:MAG: type II toxin-antitoxin system VapB family antitoxin [Spirochaetales bacterium]|nr:type II toxin-antitoxin system VapB family antitoxin [Spirochaetales bacterium]
MRTTLDLPRDLVDEAMRITKAKTKTELIKLALTSIIEQDKRERVLRYHGALTLDIDLDVLRDRR